MSSIVNIGDFYEAVLRSTREKEKSYDEAVKEFLEVFEDLILNRKKEVLDLATPNMDINAESSKKGYDRAVKAYLNAKEKYKTEPKLLLDWIVTKSLIHAEDSLKSMI